MTRRTNLLVAAALLLAALPACRFPRDDDGLEPNDDPANATPLAFDAPVEARANQGDPDVFAIDVPEPGGALVLRVDDRGLEDLPSFTLTAPSGEDALRDGRFVGRRPARPAVQGPDASLTRTDAGYELRVNAAPGRWFLTIEEMGDADNQLLYSWDYRVSASLE